MLKFNYVLLIILSALILSISIVYFIVASQEYAGLEDALSADIAGEILEGQIETAFFIGAGILYLGFLAWILKSRFKSKIPFIAVSIISAILIVVYIASRTIGVPIIGVELYVAKIDILAKILQILIIIDSVYLVSRIRKMSTKELNP